MIKYNINNLSSILKSNNEKVVLYGATDFGELCLYAMKQKNIKVDFFCDSSKIEQGKSKFNIKIISPEELQKFDSKANIFISNNYVNSIVPQLKKNIAFLICEKN